MKCECCGFWTKYTKTQKWCAVCGAQFYRAVDVRNFMTEKLDKERKKIIEEKRK